MPSAGGRRGRGARPGHPPDKHGVGRDTVGRGATQPGGWVSSLPSSQGPGQKHRQGQPWAPRPPGASAGRGRGAEVTSAETQGGGPAKGTAMCGTPEMPVLAARGVGGGGQGRDAGDSSPEATCPWVFVGEVSGSPGPQDPGALERQQPGGGVRPLPPAPRPEVLCVPRGLPHHQERPFKPPSSRGAPATPPCRMKK